jgi:leader peptidase (prepilin peptidase)/N-methyltransferase
MHTLTVPRVSTSSAVTVTTVAAVWCVVAVAQPGWNGVAAASTFSVGVVAALVDLRQRRLPDRLVILAALPSVVAAAAFGAVVPAVLGALVFAGPLVLVHLVSPSAMGFGDVKFAAALGLAIGLFDPTWSLVALCVASGIAAVAGVIRSAPSLPFGPGLLAGAVAAVVASAAFPGTLSEGRLPWR